VLEKARKEKEFYDNLFRSDNSLNKQLKASEDGKSMVSLRSVSLYRRANPWWMLAPCAQLAFAVGACCGTSVRAARSAMCCFS
jgi:hypothetical protein